MDPVETIKTTPLATQKSVRPNTIRALTSAKAGQIIPIAYSKPIPSDLIAVHGKLDPALVAKVRKVFINMSQTPQGRKQLWDLYRIDSFVDATPSDFEPVREAFGKDCLPLNLPADVYFLSSLPVLLEWPDVAMVGVVVFLLAWLATVYPAWKAARLDPVRAIRES